MDDEMTLALRVWDEADETERIKALEFLRAYHEGAKASEQPSARHPARAQAKRKTRRDPGSG